VTVWKLAITWDLVNSFIGPHQEVFCDVKSGPPEAQPLEVPCGFLNETITCMVEFVRGYPMNLDLALMKLESQNEKTGDQKAPSSPNK
jgi:hypothetical protein